MRRYLLDSPILTGYLKGRKGDIDTLIATTALVYDLTLVTTDSDFTRVPQLDVMFLPREVLKA
jgi:predicted nucleic acid-binding protein